MDRLTYRIWDYDEERFLNEDMEGGSRRFYFLSPEGDVCCVESCPYDGYHLYEINSRYVVERGVTVDKYGSVIFVGDIVDIACPWDDEVETMRIIIEEDNLHMLEDVTIDVVGNIHENPNM